MNAKQIADLVRSGLLAAGVSASILSYISDELWLALGTFILTVGVTVWQVVSGRLTTLLKTVEASPEVVKVVVTDPELADNLGYKVEALE